MTMTLEDRAKLAVHELRAGPAGPDAQTEYVLRMLRLAVADEREACIEIAQQHGEFCRKEAQNGGHPSLYERGTGATHIADKIRARAEHVENDAAPQKIVKPQSPVDAATVKNIS